MFELSVAFKYLIPRWRQLSVSIISLISILVIALVVWLITVFFSVTHGLEKGWIQKLIALTAPIRIYPTEQYYNSYYYLSDSVSNQSNYSPKSIGEKLIAIASDPYDPEMDQEIPPHWATPDLDRDGNLKDPVKLAFAAIGEIKGIEGLKANEYEMTVTNLKLSLIRERPENEFSFSKDPDAKKNQTITQPMYLSAYDPENPNLVKAMFPVSKEDVENLVHMAWVKANSNFEMEEVPFDEFNDEFNSEPIVVELTKEDREASAERIKNIFDHLSIGALKTSGNGVRILEYSIPEGCRLEVCALKVGKNVKTVYVPQDSDHLEDFINRPFAERVKTYKASLVKKAGKTLLVFNETGEEVPLSNEIAMIVDEGITLKAALDETSLETAKSLNDILFAITFDLQDYELGGKVNWKAVEVDAFNIKSTDDSSLWLFSHSLPQALPSDAAHGDAVLLPKNYRTAGALIGDRGYLSYQTPTATSVQEQRVPIYVAGFYDPGIFPLGNKILMANQDVTSMIRSSYPSDHSFLANGINVRFDNLDDAELVKTKIEEAFQKAGIDQYWKVETYREFEFTRDFLQQLRSERNLFTLISIIVIIVACSNIVSMLIILVNNKRMEIGILRSMGAPSTSIAFIFGTCGILMGLVGSIIGLAVAWITLQNLHGLINLISRVQGFDMFNPVFFGDTLPNQISVDALAFVICATTLISLIAGVIPAVKACLMRPSAILRSE